MVVTTDPVVACKEVDVAILIASAPQKPGTDRKDVMPQNVFIYKMQASCLSEHASRNVKVMPQFIPSLDA